MAEPGALVPGRSCPPSYGGSPRELDAVWPAGSAAAVSYRQRIANGPSYVLDQALGRASASEATCA